MPAKWDPNDFSNHMAVFGAILCAVSGKTDISTQKQKKEKRVVG